MARPETPRLQAGDKIIVLEKTYGKGQPDRIHQATVISVARVKVRAVVDDTYSTEWTLRLDNQEAAATRNPGTTGWWRTEEQHAWEQEQSAAYQFLQEQGIYPHTIRGPLGERENRIRLADTLRGLLAEISEEN